MCGIAGFCNRQKTWREDMERMKGMFEKSKNITWLENNVKIMSSLSDENVAEIDAMAEELCK